MIKVPTNSREIFPVNRQRPTNLPQKEVDLDKKINYFCENDLHEKFQAYFPKNIYNLDPQLAYLKISKSPLSYKLKANSSCFQITFRLTKANTTF